MFDNYDDKNKIYQVKDSTGNVAVITAQQLYEFYIFDRHEIKEDFVDVKAALDSGQTVYGQHFDFDFVTGTHKYLGALVITRTKDSIDCPVFYSPNKAGSNVTSSVCDHKDKYVNSAGGKLFYFCRSCRQDLGDV